MDIAPSDTADSDHAAALLRIKLTYLWRHRRLPRLDDPTLFTELVQLRKLYDRDRRLPAMADKVAVKALVADRRGDVLLAQGKKDDAKAAYMKAWTAMDPTVEYRRLVEAKLTAMGAAPSVVITKVQGAKP